MNTDDEGALRAIFAEHDPAASSPEPHLAASIGADQPGQEQDILAGPKPTGAHEAQHRSRRWWIPAIAAALVAAAIITPAIWSSNGPDGLRASTEAFVSTLHHVNSDYEPSASPQDLAADATLTVTGTVTSVDDGRVFGTGPDRDTEPVFLNATLTVAVDDVLAGDRSLVHDSTVYVEVPRSPEVSIATIQRTLPKDQKVLLFLDDYTEGPGSFPQLESSPAIPDGETVFAPYTDGFLLEDQTSGAIVGGLEPLDSLPPEWQNGAQSLDSYLQAHFDTK